VERQRRRLATPVGPGLALALALAACAPRALPEEAPAAEAPAAEAAAAQVDAQGRRYLVRSLPKEYGRRIEGERVQSVWGLTLELAGEDDTHWYYKYYLPETPAAEAAEELAPAAATRAAPEAIETAAGETLRFEAFGEGLPQRGQWRDGFDLADLDGDGELDLVHGPARKGAPVPQIFLGDGRGHWRRWSEARFPDLAYDYGDARAGDLDGDGALDLVLAVHLRGLLALRGDGRGGFTRAGEGLEFAGAAAAPFSSRAIRVGDFDRDGRPDVLALGEGPRLGPAAGAGGPALVSGANGLVLYRGLGAGRFARRDRGTGAAEIFGRTLALGDFDGDGRGDVAASSGQLGRLDLVQLASDDGLWRGAPVASLRPRSYVHAVAAADFDGDGRSELAVGYASIESGEWRTGVDVHFPSAAGSWRRLPVAAEAGREGPRSLATGDLDGDGAPDLVSLGAAGDLAAFRGDGRGGFVRERRAPPPFAGACTGAHLAIADLDGDGRGDVVASFAKERSSADPERCPSEGGLAAWRSLPAR